MHTNLIKAKFEDTMLQGINQKVLSLEEEGENINRSPSMRLALEK